MNPPTANNVRALRNLDDAEVGAPTSDPWPPEPPSGVAFGDWNDLFCAVKSRLTLCVGELSKLSEPLARETADRVRASVLECVGALDQLQTTLTHEIAPRQQLELEVFEAHTALALVRAEFAGTQAAPRQARQLDLRDSLTLLPKRSFFQERIHHALAHAAPRGQALAVLHVDLDAFKAINDRHGQETGDELLRIVAVRLARAVRAADVVSRLGGDEFGCLLAGSHSRVQLSHLACKLFDVVSAPLKIGELRLTVRPSIGIATFPGDGTTAEALLRDAEAAMYRAKRQRTGYAFWSEPLSA